MCFLTRGVDKAVNGNEMYSIASTVLKFKVVASKLPSFAICKTPVTNDTFYIIITDDVMMQILSSYEVFIHFGANVYQCTAVNL